MKEMSQPIVMQALEQFRKGNYQQAMQHYQLAARQYGHHLFANNIRLCEMRIARSSIKRPTEAAADPRTAQANTPNPAGLDSDIARQLEKTQQLLEHYFIRCQELEYQLLDRASVA
jgi:hypothetical protein